MQASKQQLVLSGIVVLGIIALGVDRLVLSDGISGPAQASALPTSLSVFSPTEPDQLRATTTLSQRLRAIALYQNLDLDHASNAFSLEERDAALRPTQHSQSMSTNERAFRDSHRLVGVMVDHRAAHDRDNARSHAAFIEILKPGQSSPQIARVTQGEVIDGYTVIQLGLPGTDNASSPFVVLSRNGVTFRLFAADGH